MERALTYSPRAAEMSLGEAELEDNGDVMAEPERVLVACYSLTGNTARIAQALAKRLDADVELIQEERPRRGLMARVRASIDAARKLSSSSLGHNGIRRGTVSR